VERVTLGEHYLEDALRQLDKLKQLADGAIAQIDDEDLMRAPHPDGNAIGVVMKHLAGNMHSRWTDFLTTDGLLGTVTVRGEPHTVMQAIDRQITHYAYHVGQIVLLARGAAGDRWQSLSIPRGQSEGFDVSKDGTPYLADPGGQGGGKSGAA
jgi:hypothetical protein